MKKSTIVTLVVAIVLIVLGFVLVGCGIASSYDSLEYRFGRTMYFQSSYVSYSLTSKLLTTFGQMSFILGIAGVFLFAYLAIRNPKAKPSEPKVHGGRPSPIAHAEEVKAEEVPPAPQAEDGTTDASN